MLEIIPQIPKFKSFRQFGQPKCLPLNYTLGLTYRCNSRCRTCRIYDKKAKELSVAEYQRIFEAIGPAPYWITLSGGEPFLRQDIDQICQVIYRASHPAIINIPTNGLLVDLIPQKVARITENCPQSQIIINLSLDGIGEEHDDIRQVKGNYDRALKTYQALKQLKSKAANLTLGIHTVISRFNVTRFPQIYQELITLEPDNYITEIAERRVELGTLELDITPSASEYNRAIDYLIEQVGKNRYGGVAKIAQSFRLQYYRMVKHFLTTGQGLFPCYAGVVSCQIAPTGDVWPCCIKAEIMGNLTQSDYDLRKIWFSPQAAQTRRRIRQAKCACPLANAAYTNMLCHLGTLVKVGLKLVL